MTRILMILILCALATGCATTGNVDYARYVESIREQQAAEAQQIAALASASAACNGDATCVVSVAGFAALAVQGGGARGQQIQQHVRQRGAAESIALGLLGLGERVAPAHYGYKAQQAAIAGNVEMARISAGRELGMIEAVAGVTSRVADAFSMLPPSTYVGGDLISGTQMNAGGHIAMGDLQDGHNAGRDLGADGGSVDNSIRTGAINTGTQIRNFGNLGDGNRQDSPDDDSTECTGPGCMGVNRPITNPPPEPEPEE